MWVGSGRGEHLSLATHGGDTLLASWDFGSGQQQLRVQGPRPSPELVTLSLTEAGVMQLTVDGESRIELQTRVREDFTITETPPPLPPLLRALRIYANQTACP